MTKTKINNGDEIKSGNGNNGSVNGATLTSDRFGAANSAFHFDNSGNIEVSQVQFQNYINSGFSISYWFTMEDSTSSNGRHFLITSYDGVNGVSMDYYSNSVLAHGLRTGSGNPPGIHYDTTFSVFNTWKHAVLVWSAVQSKMRVYINGVLINETLGTQISNLSVCCNVKTQFGSPWNKINDNHKGKLDDIGIWSRELTAQEVSNLYSGQNIPVSTQVPNYVPTNDLVGWWSFDGNANDESGNGNNGSVNGATLTSDRFGAANSAFHFDNSGNIEVDQVQFQNYINSGFSISYWFTMEDSTTNNRHFLISNYGGGNGLSIEYNPPIVSNTLRHGLRTDTATPPQIDYYESFSVFNTWKHAVLVWSPSQSKMRTYINGVLTNETLGSQISNLSVCCGIKTQFGTLWNNYYHKGKLDDIGIWSRELTAQEVSNLYSSPDLPVELTEFNGQLRNKTIILNWQTASELNNSGFELEKSHNGIDWEVIDFIKGQGTTLEISKYQYRDLNPFSIINYYRLKQIDFDGTFEYSKVIAIEYDDYEESINVFPNPSNGLINLHINNSSKQRIKIRILGNLGRKIWESELIEGESNWKKEIEIEENGIYFIIVQIGDEIFYKQILINDES